MRVALRIAYDGRFSGYARQPEGGTVEDHLIAALRKEGLVAGSWRTGSRTDRGVCAMENVVAFTLDRPHLKGLVPAIQKHLPNGIWATAATIVPATFDPRRAVFRQYAYHAQANGEDLAMMQAACQHFVGTHDMRAFARIEERDPKRTVLAFDVEAVGSWWVFHVRGQAFLWNQVRRMVHAVLIVGAGRAPPATIPSALSSGKPATAFGIADPSGLILEQASYDVTWDPVAGAVSPRHLASVAQEARVRNALMARLTSSA